MSPGITNILTRWKGEGIDSIGRQQETRSVMVGMHWPQPSLTTTIGTWLPLVT